MSAWVAAGSPARAQTASWDRFRGPNGQGVDASARVPTRFGPNQNVLWKTSVPAGHSSPIVRGNRIFLAALGEGGSLATLALRRDNGQVLWRNTVAPSARVGFHPLNNPASSTPAADSQRVYVYFGTYGLICYSHDGRRIWERRLEVPASKYGPATSPILYRNTVILALDSDNRAASCLLALDKETGRTVWEQPRPLFRAGWSTPIVWSWDGRDELVVLGSGRLTAYDPATGAEKWWAGGFCEDTVGVPVVGSGLMFASASALGGRGDAALDASATWKMTIDEFDANKDGRIQRAEMTEGFAFIQRPELPKDNPGYGLPIRDMNRLLSIFDRDRDGVISEVEWMAVMKDFEAVSGPTLLALKPGAVRDARPSHVAWEIQRGVPETSSLLCVRGRLYLMRDGGLLTCLRAADGKELFRERIGAPGQYIASPIAAGDRLVTVSTYGIVTVIQAADTLRVLARNDLGERAYATPAIAGETLYVRTASHLYAFGERRGRAPAP